MPIISLIGERDVIRIQSNGITSLQLCSLKSIGRIQNAKLLVSSISSSYCCCSE